MIGKIMTGKSFKGCLQYCLQDKKLRLESDVGMKDRAEVLLYNQCYGNAKELATQFNEVRALNPRLERPVLHITLSLAPGESLSNEQLMELGTACAQELGFGNNQYLAVRHHDTKHQHIHIVANRIGFDGKTVSDSNNYKKIAQYCRKMEQRFQLRQLLNPRPFLSQEQRHAVRQDIRKQQLKNDIREALRQVSSYDQFAQRMQSLGYEVLKGRGIAFRDQKQVYTKGSEVGFSWMKIEKILALKKELSSREKMEQTWQLRGRKNQPLVNGQKIPLQPLQNKVKELDLSKDRRHEIGALLADLLKPERSGNSTPSDPPKQKRRKKKQWPHL